MICNTYRGCAADIQKRMQEYFGKLCDLNTALEQWTSAYKPIQPIKPSNDHDSGMGSSTSLSAMQAHDMSSSSIPTETASTNKENPFPDDVMSIMKDVEMSVGRYMQVMMKVVAEHLGKGRGNSIPGPHIQHGAEFSDMDVAAHHDRHHLSFYLDKGALSS